MSKATIKEEGSLFDNFVTYDRPEKGRIFDAFAILSLIYIGFTIIDLAVDAKRISLKPFDWQLATAILLLPVIGLIFHLTSKKIGWIVSLFYYLTITLLMLFSRLQDLNETKNISKGLANWRLNFLLLLAFATTALLFSKPLRKYFRVSPLLLTITFVTSVGLALLMIFTLLKR